MRGDKSQNQIIGKNSLRRVDGVYSLTSESSALGRFREWRARRRIRKNIQKSYRDLFIPLTLTARPSHFFWQQKKFQKNCRPGLRVSKLSLRSLKLLAPPIAGIGAELFNVRLRSICTATLRNGRNRHFSNGASAESVAEPYARLKSFIKHFSIHVAMGGKNYFSKTFLKRFVAVVTILLVLVNVYIQNSEYSSGATFTFDQTDWSTGQTANRATHPGDQSGWDEFSAQSNADSSTTPGQITMTQNTANFSETFTTTTYKDTANTDANWNTTAGQIQMSDEQVGTDLYSKLNGILAGSSINAQVVAGNDIYIASGSGKFLKYNSVTNTATDLTAKISSFWGGNAVYSLALDSANNTIYLGGYSGNFARYNTTSYIGGGTYPTADTAYNLAAKISSFWGGNTVRSIALDAANNTIYLGGTGAQFARYNTTSYIGGGTYPTADTAYNLAAKVSSFWGTDLVQSLALDAANNVLYLGSSWSGKFARYNTTSYTGGGTYPTADTAYDLTAKISSFWGANAVYSLAFDSANNTIYLGGYSGKFARYNTTSYTGGGTYPTADTAYDLTAKISSFWADWVYSLALDSANNVLYLRGGYNGQFARYNTTSYTGGGTYPTADTAYNLTAKISSFWGANYDAYSLALDSANNVLYLGGEKGKFARYNTTSYTGGGTYPMADTAYDLTAKVNAISWDASYIYAITPVNNNEIYIGGSAGKFAKYNTATGVATDLAAKVSSFWGTNAVYSLAFDSANNTIYLGGTGAQFARYNTTSYIGGGTYPTADTAYNLTAKISSFWGTDLVQSLALDAANNVIYLGGYGKFARYNTTSYTGGGTYPTADTAYDLVAKISSFWGANAVYSLAFDSTNNTIYLGGYSGKFARYNTTSYTGGGTYPTADTAYDLTAKISSFWSTNAVYSLAFDSANNTIYLGGKDRKFARYNTTSYIGGGTYPTADTAYDLVAKISSFWGAWDDVKSLALDSANSAIYLGGEDGYFAKYSVVGDTATNLRSPDTLPFWGNYMDINGLMVNSANNKIYIAGALGYFAEKPILGSTTSAVSLTADAMAGNIYYATLTKNDTPGTGTVAYYLSNNGGSDWEAATPGVQHGFTTVGSDLRFKISVSGNATVQDISIPHWSYNAAASLTSSWYNTTDSANFLSKVIWDENATLPGGTTVQFQVQTAPDSAGNPGTGTGFVGPDGTSGTYFSNADVADCAKVGQTVTCNVPASIQVGDGTNDQWIQYKAFFSSDGQNTPQLDSAKLQYVVNNTPAVTNVTVAENSSGVLNIAYDVADSDNGTQTISFGLDTGVTLADNPLTSGATTVNLSGNYANLLTSAQTIQIDQEQITCASRSGAVLSTCTRAASNTRASSHTQNSIVWFVNTAGNVSGDAGAGIVVGTGKAATWNIKSELNGIYNGAATLRVMANDGQLANQMSLASGATSVGFALDTKNPSGVSFTINNQTNQLTIATPSDDSSYEMLVSNASDFAGATQQAFASPYTHSAMTSDPATAYVRIIDAYGNYTDASATTPAKPQNIVYYDISNAGTSEWREFIAWGAISALQVGVGFDYYDIQRSTDGVSYASIYQESDRTMNYYTDTGLNTAETYRYKVASADTAGNISEFSSVVSDQPNGQGSADQTAPTITDLAITNLNTTSATITWTTDELADSSIGYSTDQTYLPEYGNASMVTSHSITLIGLSPATTYYIRVKSMDAFNNLGQADYGYPGNNSQSSFTFTTHPGPSISNVAIANASNNQATIAWTTDINSDTYAVYSDSLSGGALVNPVSVGTPDLAGGSAPYYHTQTITGLTEGSTYYFYVESTDGSSNTATDNNGGSFYKLYTTSDNQDPVISGVNVAVKSNTEAAVNWVTDEDANSLADYGTVSGGPYPNSGTVVTYNSSHYVILTGLSPNTTYYYTVTSADINGNSAASAEYSFTTLRNPEEQHDPLSEITNISDPPAVLTDTKAVIKFNTDQAAKCVIEYGTESGNYAEVPITETLYNFNHSMHLTGLIFSTPYFYQITCADNLETSISSAEYTFTTTEQQFTSTEWGEQGDTTAPVISSVSAGKLSGESATVTWTTDEVSDGWVQYGITSGTYENAAGDYLVNADAESYATDHTVVVNNLVPSTKYYFVAVSTDAAGNKAISDEFSFTTKSPSSLSSIKVVSTALNEATITWKTSTKTTSIVEYGLTEFYGDKKESATLATEHSASLSGLESGATYHFRVKGKDADNNWFSSGDYTFEPKSPPHISNVKVVDVTEHGAKVQFATNVPTDALVTYTDSADNENSGSQGKPDLATNHEVELKNLKQGTTFALTIKARDLDGNETIQEAESFTTGKDENPPVIDQVRTDSALTQNDNVQTIISWTTDELADTSLLYREGRSGEEKEVRITDNETLNHVAVITTFKSGVVYYFKVKSVDQSENIGLSSEYALLTPKKKENVVQLIINNFEQIFGWAKR